MRVKHFKHLSLLGALLLSACASSPQTSVDYVKATERFDGMLPCQNCRGVDTHLVLNRDAITGAPAGFYLHEERIDAPGGERVSTSWGEWSRHRDINDFQREIYVLQPEVGDIRAYQPVNGGGLAPLDDQGRPLLDDEGDSISLTSSTPDLALQRASAERETQ